MKINFMHLIQRWNEKKNAPKVFCIRLSIYQFSHSVVSDSLQSHGLQHSRLPCPSPTPRPCSNSCPLSRWCHPTISSSYPLLLPPSVFPSIRVFSSESVLHIRCPKDWASGRMHWWKFCSFNTVLPCPPSLVSFPSSAGRLWQEPALLFDFLNCSIIALPGKSHGRRSLVGCSPWGR